MHLQMERFHKYFLSGITTTYIALEQYEVQSFANQHESHITFSTCFKTASQEIIQD